MHHTLALLAEYGFAIVALVIFAGEIGIPVLIPGELMLFIAGNELLTSPFALLLACVALAMVDFLASLTLYLAARGGGNFLLRLVLKRFSQDDKRPEDVLAGWRRWIGGRDEILVCAIRVVPGIRISGSMLPGLLGLPLRRFVGGALPASFVWASIPLVLGYKVREHSGVIGIPDTQVLPMIGLGLGLAILVAGSVWWVRHSPGQDAHRSDSGWTSAS
jgi:membrane protein DedA with SNARE-associated domain